MVGLGGVAATVLRGLASLWAARFAGLFLAAALVALPAGAEEGTAGPASFAAAGVVRFMPDKGAVRAWPIVDGRGRQLHAVSVVRAGDDLYFLQPRAVLRARGAYGALASLAVLTTERLEPPGGRVGSIPVQEFLNFAFTPERKSLVVLDKSGDIFELVLGTGAWRVLRANHQVTNQPDPEFVDLASDGSRVYVLDPERNQIWRFPAAKTADRLLPEIMPWKVQRGDANVSDGVSIGLDGYVYVLKRHGNITRYGVAAAAPGRPVPFRWRALRGCRPSRLTTAAGTPLFVVERETNRVLAIDKSTGACSHYLFPSASDLRGLLPERHRFFVLDGTRLVCRLLSDANRPSQAPNPRRMDPRLDGLVLPIEGARLPRHPGVWPGARRLYRFGVHKGVDFFADPACGVKIAMGTPVRAADGGKVIRADVNFRDMDAASFSRVMRQCRLEHATSQAHEDLFRGCQVWLDHGNGLVTRYAHLNGVREGLVPGAFVGRGETIGYVGVSGTGQNLPGRVKHPHLHFEIWLDGKYLGWGLTPAETFGLLEDIFGSACERGNS
jgi:hypothetical protein